MSEREEAYRAAKEAREGFVQRAVRGSRSSAASVTRMVNAAVYRYEHQVPEDRQDGAAETPESTEDDPTDGSRGRGPKTATALAYSRTSG